uniref:Uncharacterized protein n=1 Tax=Ananas comosus var. bracteatus TaxID=296719 RepID=A0A6V7QBD6_ANACO|nr:unnamed protein product [Ananas comosus var. bracteatus]
MAKPLLPLTSLLLLLLLLLPLLSNPSAAVVAGTANDVLPKFGLPPGLLPNNKTIKGKLSYGAISDLSGIQAKKFFIWVPVTGIVAHPDSRSIEFQVGFISESLPVDQFETVPFARPTPGISPN